MMKKKSEGNINEEEFTAKELLIFLQYDLKMSPNRWRGFCQRYAGRNIAMVIKYCKTYSKAKITPKVVKYLAYELEQEAKRLNGELT